MSNTVAGRRQFDNSQDCIAKKRQWRRHANENTLEQNASIGWFCLLWRDVSAISIVLKKSTPLSAYTSCYFSVGE